MSTLSNYAGSKTDICHTQTMKTALIIIISKFAEYIITTATKNRTPVVFFKTQGIKYWIRKYEDKKDDINDYM